MRMVPTAWCALRCDATNVMFRHAVSIWYASIPPLYMLCSRFGSPYILYIYTLTVAQHSALHFSNLMTQHNPFLNFFFGSLSFLNILNVGCAQCQFWRFNQICRRTAFASNIHSLALAIPVRQFLWSTVSLYFFTRLCSRISHLANNYLTKR